MTFGSKFTPNGFSFEIFKKRYALTPEESWEEACSRLATQAALAEDPNKMNRYREQFEEMLVENLFVPGGRIWYGSGRRNPSLLNCFVLRENLDSKEGWGDLAKEMIITSMSGGGCGIDFSSVRGEGSPISGHTGICPGPLELMKLIAGCGDPIRAGGGRRTALMFGLNSHHPDIMKFIKSKRDSGSLTLANISVKLEEVEEFIQAVKSGDKWVGSLTATELWDEIVKGNYYHAEPGILNWDLVEKESPISYLKNLVITNPCGEAPMSSHESCCLGHLVLPRFIKGGGDVDWSLLESVVRRSVRYLDNILSVTQYPLQDIKLTTMALRRIGLGTTGLADALILAGYRYGSEESLAWVDNLYRTISKMAYEQSALLAVERGSYTGCDGDQVIKTGFVKRMPRKIKELIQEHGIRNCTILTAAPTGTVSILSGNCSAGIEPIFAPAYERRFWDGPTRKTEVLFHPLFKQYIDEGKDTNLFVGSRELTPEQHFEMQATIQKHVDGAISKTINLPEDFPIDKLSDLWLQYLPRVKGTTFYRENTRGYVDANGNLQEPPLVVLSKEEAMGRKGESCGGIEQGCSGGSCSL